MEKFAENTSFRLPDQFQYCMLSQCPINSSCLRYQAFLTAPDDMQYFSVLNPAYLLKQDLIHCNQYYSQTLDFCCRIEWYNGGIAASQSSGN